MNELTISHIRKSYQKKTVLHDISLQVSLGECIGILGGNGCGKTTFLSILAGVLKGDGGTFVWRENGREADLFQNERLRTRLLGYVPQGTPLLEELTARDNLLLWYDRQTLEEELRTGMLAMLGIPDFLKKTVSKLSGGMKKRLSFGCAIAGHPDILLLDEPTAALDLICKERIFNYMGEFKDKGGILLLVTHDTQGLAFCDRWFIIREGRLVPYTYDGNVHRLVGNL
jgi:ABC-2 type transport system ATP-binding protein